MWEIWEIVPAAAGGLFLLVGGAWIVVAEWWDGVPYDCR